MASTNKFLGLENLQKHQQNRIAAFQSSAPGMLVREQPVGPRNLHRSEGVCKHHAIGITCLRLDISITLSSSTSCTPPTKFYALIREIKCLQFYHSSQNQSLLYFDRTIREASSRFTTVPPHICFSKGTRGFCTWPLARDLLALRICILGLPIGEVCQTRIR